MAYLDWMKDKPATQQQPVAKTSQEQKQGTPAPQTAKEMYARQAAQDKAAQNTITPEVKAQADRAAAMMDKATSHRQAQNAPAPDGGASNAAQLQKQTNQDKVQAALSPTDQNKGQTQSQARGRSRGMER